MLSLPHWSRKPGPSPQVRAHVLEPFLPISMPCRIWLPTVNTCRWCLEGTSDKTLHLASPLSEELATPSIQLPRPKSCNHTYLLFSQVFMSNPSVSPPRYIKNPISLLPPHTTLHPLPGLLDGLQTIALCLFPETARKVLLNCKLSQVTLLFKWCFISFCKSEVQRVYKGLLFCSLLHISSLISSQHSPLWPHSPP